MKRLAPLTLAIPLLLIGCSDNQGQEQPASGDPSISSSTERSAELADPSEGIEGQIGFRHGFDCEDVDKCSVNFTVESLDVLAQCEGTTFDSQPKDTHLVKVTILLETQQSTSDYDPSLFPVVAEWSALDHEGINRSMSSSSWCSIAGAEEYWVDTIRAGDSERRVHLMDVPDGATKIRLTESTNGARWEFLAPTGESTIRSTAAATPAASAPASSPPAGAPATASAIRAPSTAAEPVAPAPVIGMTEAPGAAQPSVMNKSVESCGDATLHQLGTTFFTDGTSGWTQQCADEMMPAVQSLLQEQSAG